MDRRGIEEVLKEVLGPNTPMKEINGWISISCPLARWKHEKSLDMSASAGVSIQPTDTSVFNCYACKTKVPFQALIKKYGEYTGEDFSELVEELEEEAYLGPRKLPSWDARIQDSMAEPQPLPSAEEELDLYDPAAGHPYLVDRGIDDATADLLELKIDPGDRDGFERILFPVFGAGRELYGFSGRDTTGKANLKVRDYAGLPKAQCLLGLHLIDPKVHKYVIVVEGLFDYANAWAQGEPAVAVMHSTLTPYQAMLLRDLGLPTYLFYDNDDAGKKGVDIAGEQLSAYMPVMKVRYPKIWIEDESEKGGGHWVKDPGELLARDFERMRKDARLY